MEDREGEIQQGLARLGVSDPAALLAGLFAHAPVGFQIYSVTGQSLLTNHAFRELFGSEPPPTYNIFQDEVAEARGVSALIRRAFQGETIQTPPVWYDPRDVQHVKVTEGKRVAIETTAFPLRDAQGKVTHVAIAFKDVTAEHLAADRATAEVVDASIAMRRAGFLSRASIVLSESLDYMANLARIATLAVPTIADWCTVAIQHEGAFRRVAAVHRDPAKRGLIQEYLEKFPPDQHRAGGHASVLESGRSVLMAGVDDQLVTRSAQDGDHLRIMRGLGVTSCIMVPLVIRGRTEGVLSFMLSDDRRRYGEADLLLAEELAGRAALAVENARLYRSEQLAHAEAEAQRARLESLFLQAPALITIQRGPEHIFELVHPLARAFFGDRDLVGLPIRQALPELEGQGFFELMDRVFTTGETAFGSEVPARFKKDAYLNFVYQPWRDRDKRIAGVLTFAVDVTEQVLARKRIEEALRAREEFLAVASHELKTPLTALVLQVGALGRALERHECVDPAAALARAKLATIQRHVARFTGLVDSLLDVSRIMAGRVSLELEEIDLAEVLREAVARFRDQLHGAGCTIDLAVEPCRGQWDPLRLEQIASNLLTNAIKYGAGHGIEVSLRDRSGVAELTVRDHGIGISEPDQQRIFDRFERAVSERHYGGLGLGLWIVRQIARSFGGEVTVHSVPGQGAEFLVSLPMHMNMAHDARGAHGNA